MYKLLISLAGTGIGLFTGLAPGIHYNTVTALLISVAPLFLKYMDLFSFIIFITSITTTSALLDIIPSIFFGCPSPETSLTVLPGHQMLLQGKGYEAIKLVLLGGLIGCIFCVICSPFIAKFFALTYSKVRPYTHFLLIGVVAHMILTEKGLKKKIIALFVLILSGIFGLVVLRNYLVKDPLFPALTGLFGFSTIISSLYTKSFIRKQEITRKIPTNFRGVIKGSISGLLASLIIGYLPGVGPAQSTVLISEIFGVRGVNNFLLSTGAINAIDIPISLVAMYSIGRPRSAAISVIQKMLPNFRFIEFLYLIVNILFVSAVSCIAGIFIAKKLSVWLSEIDYQKISLIILIFISGLIFLITGPIGVLISITGTSIGLIASLTDVKQSTCMGFLLLTTILFFFGI